MFKINANKQFNINKLLMLSYLTIELNILE
jgi:hypothetical protein